MKPIWMILIFLGILAVGIYLLNKIDGRKVNSYNQDSNHNLSQIHEDNNNQNTPRL